MVAVLQLDREAPREFAKDKYVLPPLLDAVQHLAVWLVQICKRLEMESEKSPHMWHPEFKPGPVLRQLPS